jgi:hypothetical protein
MIGDLGSEFRRRCSCTHPSEYDRYVDAEEIAKACKRRSENPSMKRPD